MKAKKAEEEKRIANLLSPAYKEYIRKLIEIKDSRDRAQRRMEIREKGIVEDIEICEDNIRQFVLDLLDQGLTLEEIRQYPFS